jgi:mono/diheme cytochrome c family protein
MKSRHAGLAPSPDVEEKMRIDRKSIPNLLSLSQGSGLLALLMFVFIIFAFLSASASGDELARGRYLVEALMACDNCHTPRGPDGYEMSLRFSGGTQVFSEKDYTVRGSNISPDQLTGIGAWSDTQIRAAIIEGVGPTGRLAPVMPSESYRVLTPQDLEAIIDFLRASAPASSRLPPQQKHGALEQRPAIPGAEAPFTDADLSDRLKRGLYLASLARCMSCHTGESEGASDPRGLLGAGGKIFRTPAGVVVASNITSHPTKGVGAWTDEELKRAITHGIGQNGAPLAPTMANLSRAHFSKLKEEDVDALIAWLRILPPRE